LDDWKQGFLSPGYFGLVIAAAVWIVPESPQFVMSKKGREAARAPLQRVRAGDVSEELDSMEEMARKQASAGEVSYAELFTTPGLRKRLFVACALPAAQQFTGVNFFVSFSNEIFLGTGMKQEAIDAVPFGGALLFQWVGLICVVIGLLWVDSPWGGRKIQLNIAGGLMGTVLVLSYVAQRMNWPPTISAICVYAFFGGFQMAWGIVPWFYPAELFSLRERAKGMSLATASNFLANFVVGWYSPKLQAALGDANTMLAFGILNFVNLIFVNLCMKETKGVPLDDIPAMFDGLAQTKPLMADA